jgi:hypothetical protein
MRLADLGMELFPREQQTPEALATFHTSEIEQVVADHQSGWDQGRMNPSTDWYCYAR